MAAVLSRLTGLPQEDAEALTSCTTTPYAYEALINGVADLLLNVIAKRGGDSHLAARDLDVNHANLLTIAMGGRGGRDRS